MADPTRPQRPAQPARPAPAPRPPAANSRPVQARPNAAQREASRDAAAQAEPTNPPPRSGDDQVNRNSAGQRITRTTPPTRETFATAPGANDAFAPDAIAERQEKVRQQRRERADKADVVPADEAMRDAETVAPNVSVAAPNPRPRPGVTATQRERIGVADATLPAAQSKERIKVQATRLGYYDLERKRPGDVFFVHGPEAFSERWMRKVAEDTPVRTTTMTQALRQEQDALRSMRRNEPFAARTNQAVRDQFQAEQNQEPPDEGFDDGGGAVSDQDVL